MSLLEYIPVPKLPPIENPPAKAFPELIVTQVVPLKGFYPAEAYHQNYLERHPDNPYIVINDLPKLDLLREKFPQLYKP